MENPVVSNIRKRSSKSRSRSSTPIQKYFLSSSDEHDVPALNTRSSSRNSNKQCFVVLDESLYHKYKTSDYSSEEGEVSPSSGDNKIERQNRRNGHKEEQDRRDLLAYKEYHEAGEYWNKYPKTDYTYSKRSPHRRELSSGSVALPNMSRPSLHSFDERMEKKFLADRVSYSDKCTSKTYNSLTKNTYKSFTYGQPSSSATRISERFTSSSFNGRDIVDVAVEHERNYGWFTRMWQHVANAASWTKSWFVRTDDISRYRTPMKREMNLQRGILSRTTSAISNFVLWLMTWVYWVIGTVLILDCKLLCGRETPPGSRRRALTLLLLLPLLLLLGYYLYLLTTVPEYYPFDYPLSHYPNRVYDTVLDTVDYSKVAAENGVHEISELFVQAKDYGWNVLDNMNVTGWL